MTESKFEAYIYDHQLALFGEPRVIGFGDTLDLSVREIDRQRANDVVVANHYSKKFYNASTLHFGVFDQDRLCGVLQFGFAMNPASMASVVATTGADEYLELNRMWMSDKMGRNTESRALGLCIKAIRRMRPKIKWIQSFADERCNLFGAVYQSANFQYYGEHTAVFWELDGEFYHNSLMTRAPELTPAAAALQARKAECKKHEFRQFRYIYWMKPRFAKNCLLKQKPFPKPGFAVGPVDEGAPTPVRKAQPLPTAPDHYDAWDDLGKSVDAAYEAIRERVAAGGPGFDPNSR